MIDSGDRTITLDAHLTTWHITWGTYGTRLHHGDAPTVERSHNAPGDAFVEPCDIGYEIADGAMTFDPVTLTDDQRRFIQNHMPAVCERGGWGLRVCAAATNHVHALVDVHPDIHGKQVRKWMKRWLTEALNEAWPAHPLAGSTRPGSLPVGCAWWAEGGSTKAVKNLPYLINVTRYIERQVFHG